MAATVETALKNTAVDGVKAAYTWLAAHTAQPSSGSNQTGSRAQTTWGSTSGGESDGSSVDISIGAGVTVSHYSLQSASSSGTQAAYEALPGGSHEFTASGIVRLVPTLAHA